MQDKKRARREEQIIDAAFALLDQHGAAGMSMLAVARAAKASNETLYKWYGDKLGLFRAMAERNGAEIRDLLERAAAAGEEDDEEASPLEVLDSLGPLLLRLLTGDRAVALARAAASDATGALGAELARAGREAIAPMIGALFPSAPDRRALKDAAEAHRLMETSSHIGKIMMQVD